MPSLMYFSMLCAHYLPRRSVLALSVGFKLDGVVIRSSQFQLMWLEPDGFRIGESALGAFVSTSLSFIFRCYLDLC